ncbi:MAG: lipopolysaccharide heptosyltransferase II [Verrucomicrobia bacterium]|nr:MAG: lipopolysaccharide heptosyltransferase II [Verrucomicrobiota bacterium]
MDHVVYWIVLGVVKVVRSLPLSICFATGRMLGALAWAILPTYRRLARENMSRAFGDEYSASQIRDLVFKHFVTVGANFLSALKMPALDERAISNHCAVENKEFLLSHLQKGKGVVIAISHIGNWELFAQLNFMLPNVPTGTIYQRLRNKGLNRLIDNDRRSRGVLTFDRKKGFVGAVALLRKGGVVGVLVDQHAGDSGLWTPFFRRLASTSPLPATLARKSGAAVVPVAIFTTGFARWKISVSPAIPYDDNHSHQLTADINLALEKQIRESPADWFWIHNRWKLPDPRILLAREKRGIYLPDNQKLQAFSILIRSSNWLGDAIMSVPTVQALKKGRADTKITVLTVEKLAELWKAIPEVDEVLTIDQNLWNTARKLREKFDVAILFPNSMRSALEVFLADIPRRIGYRGHHRRWLLNQLIDEPTQLQLIPKHHAERFAHMAIQLGGPSPIFQPLHISTKGPSSSLGLCPGAEYGSAKRWPAHCYREVVEKISQQTGLQWKIFGTAKDSSITQEIISGLPKDIISDLTGKTDMAQLISELVSVRLLLTNDTGTMHLASLLGVPVVAIFGSTEPLLTAPFGNRNRILRHQVECSPCFLRTCPMDLRCMKEITVQQVTAAILEILDPPGKN